MRFTSFLLPFGVLINCHRCSETSTAAVAQQTEPDICQLLPVSGQRLWQEGNRNVDVVLNRSNIACPSANQCSSTSLQGGISASIIQVDLQLEDSLTLWFDSEYDENITNLHLVVNQVSEKEINSCRTNHQSDTPSSMKLTEVRDNVTIGAKVFLARSRLFTVSLYWPSTECHLEWRFNVTVKPQQCSMAPATALCSGHGICFSEVDKASFKCHCCPGYIGRYCEEKDGCHDNPCMHGGFCVDIAEGLNGTTYQCLCRHGYAGQSCQEKVNLCDRKPCQNNGTCHGNQTFYKCYCPQGFEGVNCETNINECQTIPCVHGLCEDGIAEYKCYCLPGYGGDHCEFEYDECDSSPCINKGICEDLVAGYKCHCGPGYRGTRCQIKVDLCHPNPCPEPAECVDRGNNYSCICRPGYNGPGCTQHYDPCYPSPCQNGGTCWPRVDSFSCSCLPGYTGELCNVYPVLPLPRTLEDTSVQATGNKKGESADITLDHLHSIYIAAATLASACLLVLTVVVACHCRIHKSYQRFTRKLSRSCSEVKQQKLEDPDKFLLNLRGADSERSCCPDPGYEATSVDLADNIRAPLID